MTFLQHDEDTNEGTKEQPARPPNSSIVSRYGRVLVWTAIVVIFVFPIVIGLLLRAL